MKKYNTLKKIIFLFVFVLMASVSVQAKKIEKRIPTKGYATMDEKGVMKPYKFDRRVPRDNDVTIEILYSGVCHSDVHQARGHWGNSQYPMVPGHEIVGRVTAVGKNVKNFKVGDYAGVGAMINSCKECEHCKRGEEQFCVKKSIYTYNSVDYTENNSISQGGYAKSIVVDDRFVFKIPNNMPIHKIGPLFCAGVTVYSPLKNAEIKKGDKVGVAGFGGLGHLALQYAISMGAEVTIFDISEEKREIAMKMGAKKYVNINNAKDLEELGNDFKVILNLIPANYDVAMYIKMLKVDGSLVLIGQPSLDDVPSVNTQVFVENPRRHMYFSLIGGTKETQEMLDYSIKHNIFPQVEIISMNEINKAFDAVVKGEPLFRYVIDMSTLK